ncbi:FecR domain-containing protein [Reichenbachiella sp. MALMAid0571]|uniref:FecR family protein n=1 Tax=Reichenbachiella sp. MALMAid0571 TaxID=3143939 RepID=UPI0032DF7BCA
MSYTSYTTEDFVLDKEFRDWVINPEKESNLYWKEWMVNHPDKVETIKSAIALIHNLPVEKHQLSKEEMHQMGLNIESAIDATEAGDDSEIDNIIPINPYTLAAKESDKKKRRNYFGLLKIAASVAILVALSVFIYNRIQSEETLSSFDIITKENPKGQKSTIYLNDGSKVTLNANSKLSYSKPFSSDKRELILEGEAFFEVAKDAKRPFIVKTGNISTTALGTSFNILAFSNTKQVKVSLTTGKVRIDELSKDDGTSDAHLLEPGEELTYSPISGYTKTLFDIEEVTAWSKGIIYFKNADTEMVISKLERWYGVDIDTANENSRNWNITAKFDNESLENVLRSLSYSEKFQYSIDEKNILIKY